MAKFSQKFKGKEVGSAAVYAAPHTMDGKPVTGAGMNKTGAQVMNETMQN